MSCDDLGAAHQQEASTTLEEFVLADDSLASSICESTFVIVDSDEESCVPESEYGTTETISYADLDEDPAMSEPPRKKRRLE